jgi:3-dehydroquinate synthase
MLKKIPVRLKKKSYPICVGSGALNDLGGLLSAHKLTGRSAFVVSQEPVWKSWGAPLKSALTAAGIPHEAYIASKRIESEKLKSMPHFLKILEALVRADQKSRGIFVIALGGGVVGDVAGFAAAVYKRGIPFIQIPTTLTAQVDSAIGGKTAIDLPQGKNLVGAFHQPKFVLADTRTLETLPDAQYRDGLAEVVKYGVIKDKKFFEWLEKNTSAVLSRDRAALDKIVCASARIKAAVVAADEFDTEGLRIILNFGHTVGHALEAASSYAGLTHGRAVSIGMCAAADLSKKLGILKDSDLPSRLRRLLTAFGLPVTIDPRTPRKKILEALLYDKKRLLGKNRFVLTAGLGKTVVDPDVSAGVIEEVVRSLYGRQSEAKGVTAGFMRGLFGASKKSKSSRKESASSGPGPAGKPRGVVENYLDRIGVAIIKMERSDLRMGEPIRIEGPQTSMALTASSLQINRVDVDRVKRGDVFGMRVPSPVRPGDLLY